MVLVEKKIEELEEKYNIEKMMVSAIEAYLASLDKEMTNASALITSIKMNKNAQESKCQKLQSRVTKLESNMVNISNSHNIVVSDLQAEIDKQCHWNRCKDKVIQNSRKEWETLKKEHDQLKKDQEGLENQLEAKRREIEQFNSLLDDWKARYENEERKSKELNFKLEKSNELFDYLAKQVGKEAAEMKK